MAIMLSYLYKAIKDKTWKSSMKKTILVTSQTYKLHRCFHWIRVRKSVEWSLNEFKKQKNSNLKT